MIGRLRYMYWYCWYNMDYHGNHIQHRYWPLIFSHIQHTKLVVLTATYWYLHVYQILLSHTWFLKHTIIFCNMETKLNPQEWLEDSIICVALWVLWNGYKCKTWPNLIKVKVIRVWWWCAIQEVQAYNVEQCM